MSGGCRMDLFVEEFIVKGDDAVIGRESSDE